MGIIFIFELLIFFVSVILHEVAHGYVAEKLGDPTARLAGRLTLNPLSHIDPFGSVILPLLLAIPALFGAPTMIFGWAKPVPYNPHNLKNPDQGAALIALAGPLTNISIAVIFGLLLRLAIAHTASQFFLPLALIVYVNLLLAFFNLIPIPPLDGSKLLFLILPSNAMGWRIRATLEQFGFLILLILIFSGLDFVSSSVHRVFELIVGTSLGF